MQGKTALITTSCWLISTSLLFVHRNTLRVSSSTRLPWSSASFKWTILPQSHYVFVFVWLKTNPYLSGTSVVIYFRKTERLQDVLSYFEMTVAYSYPSFWSFCSASLGISAALSAIRSDHFCSWFLFLLPLPWTSRHFYSKSHCWPCKMQSDHLDFLYCHLNAQMVSLVK